MINALKANLERASKLQRMMEACSILTMAVFTVWCHFGSTDPVVDQKVRTRQNLVMIEGQMEAAEKVLEDTKALYDGKILVSYPGQDPKEIPIDRQQYARRSSLSEDAQQIFIDWAVWDRSYDAFMLEDYCDGRPVIATGGWPNQFGHLSPKLCKKAEDDLSQDYWRKFEAIRVAAEALKARVEQRVAELRPEYQLARAMYREAHRDE